MSAFSDIFVKEIVSDLEWREAELAILKKHLLLTSVGSAPEQAMLRANVALLYAHYEGFCKFAVGVYINALERRGLKRKDLKWVIAAHSLKPFFEDLQSEKRQDKFFSRIMNELNSELDAVAKFEGLPQIANLWPDLLITWMERFGLATTNVSAETLLLNSLVTNRNQIAHGKPLTIATRTALDSYTKSATLAMHEVAVGICDSLEHQSYQRHGEVSTIFKHATSFR